jgi:hypothetical protein
MKTLVKLFAVTFVMLAFSASTFAQVSATAQASAVIQTPLAITSTVDMDFGSMAATSGGTVDLALDNSLTASAGVTLIGGTPTAASFTVTGINNATYSIGIPASIVLTNGTPADDMTVDNIIHNSTGTLSGTGSETFAVGGRLNVASAQAAGTYTNTTDLTITVNYN